MEWLFASLLNAKYFRKSHIIWYNSDKPDLSLERVIKKHSCCPNCDRNYKDWYRGSVNFDLDDFDKEYLEQCSSAICPHCQHKVYFCSLVIKDGANKTACTSSIVQPWWCRKVLKPLQTINYQILSLLRIGLTFNVKLELSEPCFESNDHFSIGIISRIYSYIVSTSGCCRVQCFIWDEYCHANYPIATPSCPSWWFWHRNC